MVLSNLISIEMDRFSADQIKIYSNSLVKKGWNKHYKPLPRI